MIQLSIGKELPPKQDMISFLTLAEFAPHLAVDIEADPETDQMLGVSSAFPGMGMYFPYNHFNESYYNIDEEVWELLKKTLYKTRLRVFHNAGYDLIQLAKNDCNLLDLPFADTMLMAHMINENTMSKRLDYLHKLYTGGEGKNRHPLMQKYIDVLGWANVPAVLMNEYSTQDAVATSELFEALEPLFIEQFGELYGSD